VNKNQSIRAGTKNPLIFVQNNYNPPSALLNIQLIIFTNTLLTTLCQ